MPKKARKPRTTGMDMCECGRFNCDPFGLSPRIARKLDTRREQGLCIACGKNPCTCKSSLAVRTSAAMEAAKRRKRKLNKTISGTMDLKAFQEIITSLREESPTMSVKELREVLKSYGVRIRKGALTPVRK